MKIKSSRPLLLLSASLILAFPVAHAATQTHTATFTGAGGDARWGTGDSTLNPAVHGGFLPLFDSSLGTLDKVSIEMQGWRSISFSCYQMPVGLLGGCSARASGIFRLRADSYNPWSFITLATIAPDAATATSVAPAYGQTLSAVSYAEASTFVEITDPNILAIHFDGAGKDPTKTYIAWIFQIMDGGNIGQGGNAGISSVIWDADATVKLTYHYTAPIPEPETYALMLAGLGLVGWAARRRRMR